MSDFTRVCLCKKRDAHGACPAPASHAALTVLLHAGIDHTIQKHLTETQTCTCTDAKAHRYYPALPRPCILTLAALPTSPRARYTLHTRNAQMRQVPGENTLVLSHSAAHGQGSAWGKAMPCTPLPTCTKTTSTLHTQGQSCMPRRAISPGQQSCCRKATTVHLRAWCPPKPSTLGCCLTQASRGGWGSIPLPGASQAVSGALRLLKRVLSCKAKPAQAELPALLPFSPAQAEKQARWPGSTLAVAEGPPWCAGRMHTHVCMCLITTARPSPEHPRHPKQQGTLQRS